jgi:cytochrome c553
VTISKGNKMNKFLGVLLVLMLSTSGTVSAAGDIAAGKEKSQTCVACHGTEGVSATPQFPTIAGQYRDYLYKSLIDYKAGKRKNPIMAGIVAALSDQDMQDLASYYASLEGLKTINLP